MDLQTTTAQTIYPAIRYRDAKAAIVWLTSVLGFREHTVYAADNGRIEHAELELAGTLIMLGTLKDDPASSNLVYIALDDPSAVDACYARAKAAGAEIVREICDTDYGSHEFSVNDPEGNRWSFGTYRPQAKRTG